MPDMQEFSRRIRIIGNGIEKNSNELVKKTALAIDQTVVLATPVDTGRARSNWIVSLSVPNRNKIQPYSPGKKLGLGEAANAQAAINQARSVIGLRKTSQDIYISNNLDYIIKLNNGSSAQAPANFVGKAIMAAVRAIKGVKLVRKP